MILMNIEKMKYTLSHRKAYIDTAKRYGVYKFHHLFHDLDKVFMYIFTTKKQQKKVSKIHRKISRHHDNNIKKKEGDYIDMVIEWECARFTKPDKPLNARQTMHKYYPHLEEEITPILDRLGL